MKANITKLWGISIIVCIIFLGIIASFWIDETNNPTTFSKQITTEEDVKKYLEASKKGANTELVGQHIVPVGFFIQSLKFINSSDVNMSGYIWHKYPKGLPKSVAQGFILPEAVDSGNAILKEAFSEEHDTYLLKGWYFEQTVRQTFDYRKFPLDRKTVWLRLWAKDWSESITFVPDLESYVSVRPGKVFGMDQEAVMGQWEIFDTYFSHKEIMYDTNFGSNYALGKPDVELYYNIVVKRKFVNSFVIYLVPLFIILSMLFSVLIMITRDEERKGVFGSSTSDAIGSTVALFFVVTLSHAGIREKFAGAGLVYMEAFYFIAYIMILLVSLNTYHFTSTKKNYRLYHNDNLTAKLLYWPIILLLTLLTTASYFYFD